MNTIKLHVQKGAQVVFKMRRFLLFCVIVGPLAKTSTSANIPLSCQKECRPGTFSPMEIEGSNNTNTTMEESDNRRHNGTEPVQIWNGTINAIENDVGFGPLL